MKILPFTSLVLFTTLFYSCSTGYKNEGNAVYYEHWNEGSGQHKDKIEANPNTFKILKFDAYAKDDKSVFYEGHKILGADPETFEAIGDYYAKDKNFGWYGGDTIKTSNGSTFKVIKTNSDYSTDGQDVFYKKEPLGMVEPQNFKVIHCDIMSECWTTDGKLYYFRNFKVPSDDYNNLKIYPNSGGLSNDKKWVYFLDHKLNYDMEGRHIIDTIDILTFEVTGYLECKDKYGCINVYHGRIKCDN